MRFVFGLEFDGATWPDVLADRDAMAGERWGGPLSLLATLESQVGLTAQRAPASLRAATLSGVLAAENGFWSESAEADPFATAAELIRWDEELRLHGWKGEPVSSRLEQLADLLATIPAGLGRRFELVAEALPSADAELDAIDIVGTARRSLPRLFQRVLDVLETTGCGISERPVTNAVGAGDLAGCLSEGFDPQGTGNLQLVRPVGPLAAADAVATWLAQAEDLEGTVLIGADAVLDAALRRHGLPTLGTGRGVGADPLLQVLPLIAVLGRRPQDPAAALELLTLPEHPIPTGLSQRLEAALREWPAVGSDAWNKAMRAGLETIEDDGRRHRVTERLDALLTGTITSGDYPLPELEHRLDAMLTWLQGRRSSSEEAPDRWELVLGPV